MVVSVTELRRLTSRAKYRAGRARGYLSKITHQGNRRPSMQTVRTMGRALQDALGQLKEIAHIIESISG